MQTDGSNGVLGMRYWPGGSPAALLLPPGLTVLYGENGAGKTTLLDHLKGALAGVAQRFPTEFYVLGLPTTDLADDQLGNGPEWRRRADRGLLGTQLLAEQSTELYKYIWFFENAAEEYANARGFDSEVEVNRLVEDSVFCLRPIGTVTDPAWEVWLAAQADDVAIRDMCRDTDKLGQDCRQLFAETAPAAIARDDYEQDDPWFDFVRDAGHDCWEKMQTSPLVRARAESAGLDVYEVAESFLAKLDWRLHDGLPLPVARIGVCRWIGHPYPDFRFTQERADRLLGEAVGAPRLVERISPLDQPDDQPASPDGKFRFPPFSHDKFHAQIDAADGYRDSGWAVADDQLDHIREMSRSANHLFSRLLLNAPEIGIHIEEVRNWFRRAPLRWSDFSALSAAQSSWARFSAIRTAVDARREQSHLTCRITVIDEPEAALHRSAEANLAQGLAELGAESVARGDRIVLATHSPHLLDLPDATVHWVHDLVPTVFTGTTVHDLQRLGLRPSDLLGLTHTILLVEGVHDRDVLEALIGDSLRRANVMVIPLHGGRKLAETVDTQVLFTYTDARVVALLDNLSAAQLDDAWRSALAMGSPNDAVGSLRTSLPGNNEIRFIRQWLINALERGVAHRVSPWALSKGDIIEYLPIESLVPPAHQRGMTWDDLRSEQFKQTRTHDNFKPWLRKRYGVAISDDDVKQSATQMDSIPEEFTMLAEMLAKRDAVTTP